MHALIFRLDLAGSATSRARGRCGRSLATALGASHGFVAFIALESDDGAVTGLCICVDAEALGEAQRVADAWQRERGGHVQGAPTSAMQPLIAGEVIVQRGF